MKCVLNSHWKCPNHQKPIHAVNLISILLKRRLMFHCYLYFLTLYTVLGWIYWFSHMLSHAHHCYHQHPLKMGPSQVTSWPSRERDGPALPIRFCIWSLVWLRLRVIYTFTCLRTSLSCSVDAQKNTGLVSQLPITATSSKINIHAMLFLKNKYIYRSQRRC